MMRGIWRRGLVLFVLFLTVGSCFLMESAAASRESAETQVSDQIQSDLSQYDFSEIDRYLSQNRLNRSGDLTFSGLMSALMNGQWEQAAGQAAAMLKDRLLAEVDTSAALMGQIMILGIVGAFFSNFSSAFAKNQISESAFYVTYLLMFTFLASSFLTSIAITRDLLDGILEFMKALVPSYFLAVAVAGGSLTSMALYQFTLGVIALLEWIFPVLLLPLVRVDILFVMAGHLMKENSFSRLTELLTNIIQWSMKSMLGVVLGFQIIQGMVLPFADSMKTTAFTRIASVIPGVGQGAASISQLLLGSGVLIKNAMGAAAVVILLIISVIPILKLLLLMVLYQGTAALLQPVCDKRLVSCISEVGNGHRLLVKMSLMALFLFILSLAVVCMGTNTSYYSG